MFVCIYVCASACVRACVRACLCVQRDTSGVCECNLLLRTLVAEAFADVLLGHTGLALDVLETEARLVSLRGPVTVQVNQVVVREHVHAVVVPTNTCMLW